MRPEGLCQLKIPMTSSGIEAAKLQQGFIIKTILFLALIKIKQQENPETQVCYILVSISTQLGGPVRQNSGILA